MWLTTASSFAVFVAIHVVVTYFASERLNVFTALCMLSMLPALALGILGAAITLMMVRDQTLAAIVGCSVFVLLVLPYTGQGLWELISRRRATTALPKPRVDTAQKRKASERFGGG